MNLQLAGQPRSSNGYGRRKSETEGTAKSDNKIPSGKSNASRLTSTGELLTLVIYDFLFYFFTDSYCYRCSDW